MNTSLAPPNITGLPNRDEHRKYMGVSKNRATPKWMVKIMENPIKMDDLGENPLFSETSIYYKYIYIYIYFKPPPSHGHV